MCGLRNRATQKSLLSEKDLSLKKAVEVSQAAEAAESHANKLRAGETKETVYRTERTDRIQDTHQDRTCYRCGGESHSASTCRFKETICNKCKKRGHLARACRSGRANLGRQRQQRNSKSVRNVEVDDEDDQVQNDKGSEYEAGFRGSMFRVGGSSQTPIVVAVTVNDKEMNMELDTCAAVSVISASTYQRMFSETPLRTTSTVLSTYTGEVMALAGEIKVMVRYGEQNAQLPL